MCSVLWRRGRTLEIQGKELGQEIFIRDAGVSVVGGQHTASSNLLWARTIGKNDFQGRSRPFAGEAGTRPAVYGRLGADVTSIDHSHNLVIPVYGDHAGLVRPCVREEARERA